MDCIIIDCSKPYVEQKQEKTTIEIKPYTPEEIKKQKIFALKSAWDDQQKVFKDRMLGAMCYDGETMNASIKLIQTDWANANTEYKNKLKEIAQNG